MSDYVPIPCEDYELYERAIMRRQRLQLCWRTGDGRQREASVMPTELHSEDRAEFLLAESEQGEALKIRLDLISTARPL